MFILFYKYLFNLSLFEPDFIIVFCFISVKDKDVKSEVCQLFNESNLPGVFWRKMSKLVVFFDLFAFNFEDVCASQLVQDVSDVSVCGCFCVVSSTELLLLMIFSMTE